MAFIVWFVVSALVVRRSASSSRSLSFFLAAKPVLASGTICLASAWNTRFDTPGFDCGYLMLFSIFLLLSGWFRMFDVDQVSTRLILTFILRSNVSYPRQGKDRHYGS